MLISGLYGAKPPYKIWQLSALREATVIPLGHSVLAGAHTSKLELLKKAARSGNPLAIMVLTSAYRHGILIGNLDVIPNQLKNLYWTKVGAKQGIAKSAYNLAVDYNYGLDGVTVDYQKAIYWYQQAIKHNSIWAYSNLAIMYANGQGAQKNPEKAIELFKQGLARGDNTAAFNLGLLYATTPAIKNYALAFKYYKKAATSNNSGGGASCAQLSLATAYAKGQGTPASLSKARTWLETLAKQQPAYSNRQATQAFVDYRMSQINPKLTPAQKIQLLKPYKAAQLQSLARWFYKQDQKCYAPN